MENKKSNRGPSPSKSTIALLIARSGGRCQFQNCNKNVFLDSFTLTDSNHSNVAHIVASSPDGPRGNERSYELSNKVDNLMLMCYEHHHLIDKDEKLYTVQVLQKMKLEQERRILEALDQLYGEKTQVVALMAPIKGKDMPQFSMTQAVKAFANEKIPASPLPLYLSVATKGDYKSIEYWEYAEKWLISHYEMNINSILNDAPNMHFSVYPCAPIPLIAKLGYIMGDKIRANVYQKTRQPDTWQWQSQELTNSFDTTITENLSGNGVALVISISGDVDISKVISAANPKVIIEVHAANKGVDAIKSQEDLSCFWHKYQETCEDIKNKYQCSKISSFCAVPVSVAFEIGRRYMKGVYPLMDIYELEGEYFKTLTIGE